jgi:hypothetical protein
MMSGDVDPVDPSSTASNTKRPPIVRPIRLIRSSDDA